MGKTAGHESDRELFLAACSVSRRPEPRLLPVVMAFVSTKDPEAQACSQDEKGDCLSL